MSYARRRTQVTDETGGSVAFLGPPGAGKSTQARELAREWSVPYVATDDMLREAVAADTPLGREAKGYMDSGELMPDEAIIGLVADRLGRPDATRGFVLKGFPRTLRRGHAQGVRSVKQAAAITAHVRKWLKRIGPERPPGDRR